MALYFAPSVPAFYDDAIPAEMPADRVEISEQEHAALLGALNGGGSFKMIDGRPVAIPYAPSFSDLKAAKYASVGEALSSRLAIGFILPNGLHIAISGDVERRMTSMGTTAGFAVLGIAEWPEDYRRGWITEENIRYPLPLPSDGVELATSIGAYTAALIQYGRDLKDRIIAAEHEEALNLIDIEAGWPEGVAG